MPAIPILPVVYSTDRNEEALRNCNAWGSPMLLPDRTEKKKMFRLWKIPKGKIISGKTEDGTMTFDDQYAVMMPGVAGYPYEGRLPMAEYPEDYTLIVHRTFVPNLVYPSFSAAHPLFDGKIYDDKGSEITPDDIAAFRVPGRPMVSGMCLYGYGRSKN